MDEFLGFFPPRFVRAVKLAIAAAAVLVFAAAAVSSLVAIRANLDNATPTLGIPYWVFLGAAFAGFSMTAFECAVQFVKALRALPLYVTFPAEQEPQEDLTLPDGLHG
jgi:TRAP-type C4-dicarboxylate transport system permease small subunit